MGSNPLILAYCRSVSANHAVDAGAQRAWLLDFGMQVIQALQQRAQAGG